jgi:hypothetical protein
MGGADREVIKKAVRLFFISEILCEAGDGHRG